MSEFKLRMKIEIDGIDDTLDYLDNVKRRMRDFRPIWPALNQSLKQYMIGNFTAQGLPSGGWKPLDAEYGAWKTRNFPGAPMLVQSGKLFSTIAKGPKLDGNRQSARFMFDGRVARFHQYGTTKMPARPLLFAPDVWVNEVTDEMADWVVEGGVE